MTTWVILAGLPATGKSTLAHALAERLKESHSVGLLGSRKSYAMEIATNPLVMASEISGLEPLHGFIKQENRVVPVHFRLAKKRGRQPEFIERTMPEVELRPSPAATAAPAELSKTPSAAQAALPLFDAPPEKATEKLKKAFVWDESKGID